jgi:hypothetical protein
MAYLPRLDARHHAPAADLGDYARRTPQLRVVPEKPAPVRLPEALGLVSVLKERPGHDPRALEAQHGPDEGRVEPRPTQLGHALR